MHCRARMLTKIDFRTANDCTMEIESSSLGAGKKNAFPGTDGAQCDQQVYLQVVSLSAERRRQGCRPKCRVEPRF